VYVDENEVSWDLCVVCGQKTPYKTDENIHQRLAYVEGVGQCCNLHFNSRSGSL